VPLIDALSHLISAIDPTSLKVHVPSKVVFLCGGAIDSADPPGIPKMLRDIYFRYRKSTLKSLPFKIVLAEDSDPLNADAGYEDLLSFESDVAQIVGLIVLFVESPGSLAELGAFSALETIAPSLLAVMLDYHYNQKSFIKNGPIKYLENRHGEDSILSIEIKQLGLLNANDVSETIPNILAETVEETIIHRLDKLAKWRSFSTASDGHKILVMTGLCQEYGALTQGEIKDLLAKLGVSIEMSRLKTYLYCAELMNWVKLTRKGNQKYAVALMNDGQEYALGWKFKDEAPFKDRMRWRTDIRNKWKITDPTRHRAITEVNNG
jgi:hypothetical protein